MTPLRRLVILCLCASVGGCAPTSREQLAQEVLKADPKFASVLDKHREVASRIGTYERELALKRSTVERSIEQLRKDLASASATVKAKIAEAKKRLDPDRERLGLDLEMAEEELRAKRSQRASLGRSIAKLKKAVKSASDVWTSEERSRQEDQVQDMLRDAARLDQEMATLKKHSKLLKRKLLLLEL
jgi:hypothetical protein